MTLPMPSVRQAVPRSLTRSKPVGKPIAQACILGSTETLPRQHSARQGRVLGPMTTPGPSAHRMATSGRAPERCATTLRVELIRQGKVRDVYADGEDLILVASDRVSVYDVVLPTPIPDKGAILTQLSLWWFGQVADLVPNHVIERGCPTGVEGPGDSLPPARHGCCGMHRPRLLDRARLGELSRDGLHLWCPASAWSG